MSKSSVADGAQHSPLAFALPPRSKFTILQMDHLWKDRLSFFLLRSIDRFQRLRRTPLVIVTRHSIEKVSLKIVPTTTFRIDSQMLGQVELRLNARSLRFFFKNLERLAREKGEISSGGRGIQARFGK